MVEIHCECCGLRQNIPDRDGALPKVCDDCYPHHRGQRPETQLARAESHEAMLRKRLTACRASEERVRTGMVRANNRMVAAYESRGSLADRLVTAAEVGCSRDCPARQLARDPDVAEFARRHREGPARPASWGGS
jgi:ribosome-binding protein aMBF1 (putative translation factor)